MPSLSCPKGSSDRAQSVRWALLESVRVLGEDFGGPPQVVSDRRSDIALCSGREVALVREVFGPLVFYGVGEVTNSKREGEGWKVLFQLVICYVCAFIFLL